MKNDIKSNEGKSRAVESVDFQSANSHPSRSPSPVIPVPTLPLTDNLLTLSPIATTTVQDTNNNEPPKDMDEDDEG